MNEIALDMVEQILASVAFTDDELQQLQETIRRSDLRAGMDKALSGERAIGFQTIKNSGKFGGQSDVNLPATDDNAAFYLSHMAKWIEAAKQPFPAALDQVQQEFLEAIQGSALSRLRYHLTGLVLPASQSWAYVTARGVGSIRIDVAFKLPLEPVTTGQLTTEPAE